MRNWSFRLLLALLCSAAAFSFFGCGGDDDNDSSDSGKATNDTPQATGNWSGHIQGTDFTMTLVQNDDAITGSYACQGIPGSVSGNTSHGNIEMTVTANAPAGDVVSHWVGTINEAMDSASGTFEITAGGGGNGNWSMSR